MSYTHEAFGNKILYLDLHCWLTILDERAEDMPRLMCALLQFVSQVELRHRPHVGRQATVEFGMGGCGACWT